MPARTQINIGSSPQCELPVMGNGVAPRHAVLTWRDGLWLQDAGAGRTVIDGRQLAPGETVQLAGFHANVMVGDARVPLTHPEVSKLFLDRSPLPQQQRGVVIIGRDLARAHLVVSHPTVSGAHLQVDTNTRMVTDLGSKSGTFDRNTQRLTPNQPTMMDVSAGYSLGAVWIPSAAMLEMAGAAPGPMSAMPQPGFSTSQGAPQPGPMPVPPSQPHGFGSMQGGPSHQGGPSLVPQNLPHHPSMQGHPQQQQHAPSRTMFGSFDLSAHGGGKAIAMIGRLPTCDIVMPYPQVSGRHTSVMKSPDGNLLVGDLGSTNGTYVNGQRLTPGQPVTVPPKTRIFVGPYAMIVDLVGNAISAYAEQQASAGGQVFESANLVEIEALDIFLKVPDRENKAKDKILLNHVTFKSKPGDLIALMGPSGAGKTTLLTVLNGYLRPTSGEVRVNGENLYAIYDALRGSIGYVPQDDIVHPELTVKEAITYSARFRLPSDYSAEEIDKRVDQTIKDLGLEQVKNLQIGKPEKKVLSGGQRKRVNIALELVTDPALMFLDEPTSGLAADDTVSLIDLLSNLAKKYGKTIIVTIHQPAREEYEKFNLAFIMGFGGEPVYYGPSGKESYDFFSRYLEMSNRGKAGTIDNPRDMFDQLKVREEDFFKSNRFGSKAEARLASAQEWRKEFFRPDNPTYVKMYSGDREPGKPGQSRPPSRSAVPLIRQFGLLLTRYSIVKRRDVAGMIIMLAQAPIIGGLLAAVFYDSPRTPNLWCQNQVMAMERAVAQASPAAAQACGALTPARFKEVDDFKGAIFFLTVGALWFGVSNAAREIVSEIAIYRRERMVNLSIFNYMLSKFMLLTALCVVQCTVLLTIVYKALSLGGGTWDAFGPMLGTMILSSMCAVALGLLISAAVTSSEAAMALTPIALIPQVVLGGLLVPMTNKGWLKFLMAIMPSRWSFEGVMGAERDTLAAAWRIPTCMNRLGDGVHQYSGANAGYYFDCAVEEIARASERSGGWGFSTWDNPLVANGILAAMTLAFLGGVAVMLKRRDSV